MEGVSDTPVPRPAAPPPVAARHMAAAPKTSSVTAPLPVEPPAIPACNEQPPQWFLMRRTYVYDSGSSVTERSRKKELHRAALEYRTRHYGRVPGAGDPSWPARPASLQVRKGRFFGLEVMMNERVLVALGCVEERIHRDCGEIYAPVALSGWRDYDTFTNGEVSNHRFGIAIDVDYGLNPCCGCIAAISDRPLCKKPVASPFERTVIPRCWVDTFARYGFYWLGYDQLEDTMHFEFLGDPERIEHDESPSSLVSIPSP